MYALGNQGQTCGKCGSCTGTPGGAVERQTVWRELAVLGTEEDSSGSGQW
jgi:hypothetical protein